MIICTHCKAEFPDERVLAFIDHLQQAHETKTPFTLGNHGVCTTTPRPITPYPDSWCDGTALQPWLKEAR